MRTDSGGSRVVWVTGVGVVTVFVLIVGWAVSFVSIGKGEVGVVSWFGEVGDTTLEPGPHLVNPLKTVYRMNTQTQKDEEPGAMPTKKGLSVTMTATLLYHLDPARAPAMAREVGSKDYQDRVVKPYFRNAVRDVTAEFDAEAFYTAERTTVEARIAERARKELEARGLVVESVMILDPVLPPLIKERIEAKVGAEQEVARLEYVLKQKELEAKAKVVEAKGIAEAQTIIKKDLDDNYLRFLWIEALKESAKHNNATIYIPTGGDGMPFFKPVHPGKDK
jgi:regulator of protease activity HflC (stomatin/prohibitin superfamily)